MLVVEAVLPADDVEAPEQPVRGVGVQEALQAAALDADVEVLEKQAVRGGSS
jgi:hypothetical protein